MRGVLASEAMVIGITFQSLFKQSYSPQLGSIRTNRGDTSEQFSLFFFFLHLPLAFRQNLCPLDTWSVRTYFYTSAKYGRKQLRKKISTLWEEYTEMCIPLQNLEGVRSKELCVYMCVREREKQRQRDSETERERETEHWERQSRTQHSFLCVKAWSTSLSLFKNYPLTVCDSESQSVHK